MYPLTDRAQTIVRLILVLGIMWMAQAQDEEDIQQQIETERGYGKGPKRPRFMGWAIQEWHT